MNNESMPKRLPKWWQPEHDTRWERVRTALRRDWEQTKSDFSGGRTGVDLNQNLDDTVGQALGKRGIPEAGTANPMNAEEQSRHVRRAAEQMARAASDLAAEAGRSAERQWEAAEPLLAYGFAAAAYYPGAWTNTMDTCLRDEWGALNPERPWDDVRDTVRQGWEQGRL